MARNIAALCAERHFMGTSSSGRYATDRDARPDYTQRPDGATLGLWRACRFANRARYLREQDVVGLVAACEQARRELEETRALLERARRELALTGERAADGERRRQLGEASARLEARAEQVLARRRRLSGQLRALGISPKDQAGIWREVCRRRDAGARAGYSQEPQTSGQ